MRIRILSSIHDVSSTEWNRLAIPTGIPFLRWEWLDALESSGSAIPETGWTPQHLTLWRGNELIGLAPAYAKTHSMGEYVYDFAWAQAAHNAGIPYYPKLLVGVPLAPITAPRFLAAPGEDVAVIRQRLLEAATDHAKQTRCSSLHVIFPPQEEARALETLGMAGRTGMQYHWKNPGYRTYEDFLARFDSKRRNQLRRERAAATTQGISIRTTLSSELTRAHAQLAHRFYAATVSKNGWGGLQLELEFFERIFSALPESVEMVLAERAGQVIAGAFNVTTPERRFGRYWGCFEEHPFLHFHVCLYHSIDACIATGKKVFEPGAGGEHKIARGFEPTPIYSTHFIFEPRLDRAIRGFVQRERLEVEDIVARSLEIAGMKPLPQ